MTTSIVAAPAQIGMEHIGSTHRRVTLPTGCICPDGAGLVNQTPKGRQ